MSHSKQYKHTVMVFQVIEMQDLEVKSDGKFPEEWTFPDLEFDPRNYKFCDLEEGTIISLECYDQNGKPLNTRKVINGIFAYFTLRALTLLEPESECSKEFFKKHPSCNRN